MIRLTNAFAGEEGRPLAVNPAHVIGVLEIFDGERRINMVNGEQFIVSETFDEILSALSATDGNGK